MGGTGRWLAGAFTLVACLGMAQDGSLQGLIYPEDLREDLDVVRRSIVHLHPAPYRFVDRASLDHRFDSLASTFTVPITLPAYLTALGPVLASVGDAHLQATLPAVQEHALRHALPLLPLRVGVVDGEVHVVEELMGFRSIVPGSRVLRINGEPAGRVLEALMALVPVDGRDRSHALRVVERDLPYWYALRFGTPAQHTLEVEAPDGTRATKVLRALTGDEIERSYRPAGAVLKPWRSETFAEERTAWVTMATLDRDSLEREGVDARRFIDLVLQEARTLELRTLVIDVRGAGGSDLGMAELVFSLIAKDPYRVVRAISFRQPEASDLGPIYASVGDRSLPEADRAVQVPADDPRLALTKPYEKAFQGKVYVVCDGLTTDAGAAFVMLAKRSGRARVVGEEVGSNSASFCGGQMTPVVLPRTRLRLQVPGSLYIPEGQGSGPADHGELPHHAVMQQPWGYAKGRDTVKWSLLEMIRELQ